MREALLNNLPYKSLSDNLAGELLKNGFLSIFEPKPISFNAINEEEVDRVWRSIELASGQTAARFKTAVNRRSFLAACLDFTCMRISS
jgi:hypothetical protein